MRLTDLAIARAHDALLRGDHAAARLAGLLKMDDDHPLTVEAFMVALVDAVRGDEAREMRARDVTKAAKRRQSRLGKLCSFGGPTALYLFSLYCEVAVLCDVERAHRLQLSDEELTAHLMVLWRLMPAHPEALAAIRGDGPSVVETSADHLRATVVRGALDDGELTKRETVMLLWRLRGAYDAIELPGSASPRDVYLPGARVRELVAAAEEQLGVEPEASRSLLARLVAAWRRGGARRDPAERKRETAGAR
jgi:hypothetical protein